MVVRFCVALDGDEAIRNTLDENKVKPRVERWDDETEIIIHWDMQFVVQVCLLSVMN